MSVEQVPEDVWVVLAPMLHIYDTGAVMCTCRDWYRIMSMGHIDYLVAHSYAYQNLGTAIFWNAHLQKIEHSRPATGTPSSSVPKRCDKSPLRLEIKRIECIKASMGRSRVAMCEFYNLWKFLDTLGLSQYSTLKCHLICYESGLAV